MIAAGDGLKVSVYDDNAFAVELGESNCEIGDGTETTLGTVRLKLCLDYLN